MSSNKNNSNEGIGLLIILFFILTPIIPAGDIGLYLVRKYDLWWLSVISWAFFMIVYFIILLYIKKLLFNSIPNLLIIVLAYIQGVAFSFLLVKLGYDSLCISIVNFITYIYKLIF